jgi:flagellar biosynthesis protein FlhG
MSPMKEVAVGLNGQEPTRMATIISIASGKGGVGKSVIAANLAVLLARRGNRVVLADFDVGGADAHLLFGYLHPQRTLTDFLAHRVDDLDHVAQVLPVDPRLRLIPGTGDTLATANLSFQKKRRLIGRLCDVHADLILVDIGAGTNYHALDFFLMGDCQIAVATPDPTSVLDLYRFIKLAAIRRVLSAFAAHGAVAEAISDREFSSVEEVLDAVGKTDQAGRATAEQALQGFDPCLVVNRVSGQGRINVVQLRKLLKTYIGGDISLLGEIPEDPAMDRAVKHCRPVVVSESRSSCAAALTRLADAVLKHISTSKQPAANSERL